MHDHVEPTTERLLEHMHNDPPLWAPTVTASDVVGGKVSTVTTQIDVRTNFVPDDEALSRLHALAFGGEYEGPSQWGARLRRHSVAWAGAFDEGEVVGFVHIVWDGGLHGFLLDTVVHPAHRRRGLGRSLVELVVREARQAGCEWVHVDYEPDLEPFYRACGFTPTGAGLRRLFHRAPDPSAGQTSQQDRVT